MQKENFCSSSRALVLNFTLLLSSVLDTHQANQYLVTDPHRTKLLLSVLIFSAISSSYYKRLQATRERKVPIRTSNLAYECIDLSIDTKSGRYANTTRMNSNTSNDDDDDSSSRSRRSSSTTIMATRKRRQRWQYWPRGRRKQRASSCNSSSSRLMMMSQLLLIVTISTILHSSSSSSLNDSLTVLVGCVQEANHRSGSQRRRTVMAVFAEAFSTPLTAFNSYATSHHGRFRNSRHHYSHSRCPSSSSSLSCFNTISGATSSRKSSFLHNRNQGTSRNYFHSATTTIIANGHTSRILQHQQLRLKGATSSVTSLSLAMKATTTTRMDNLDATSISSSTAAASTSTDGANASSANSNSNSNNQANSNSNNNQNSWLDRTTARLLDTPTTSSSPQHNSEQPQLHIPTTTTTNNNTTTSTLPPLTPDDVNLITTLMTSHARRSTIESARICEQLLKRVVEEVNRGNEDVRVTTKMYTKGEREYIRCVHSNDGDVI
eukprot:scaffold6625_cov117-Skeletonema_dohrnii-CCMP3373.AAC.7